MNRSACLHQNYLVWSGVDQPVPSFPQVVSTGSAKTYPTCYVDSMCPRHHTAGWPRPVWAHQQLLSSSWPCTLFVQVSTSVTIPSAAPCQQLQRERHGINRRKRIFFPPFRGFMLIFLLFLIIVGLNIEFQSSFLILFKELCIVLYKEIIIFYGLQCSPLYRLI